MRSTRTSVLFDVYVAGQLRSELLARELERLRLKTSAHLLLAHLAVRGPSADRRGIPTMAALRRVDPATGRVTTPSRATRPVDVHGLVPFGSGVLLADNTGGRLYAVPG